MTHTTRVRLFIAGLVAVLGVSVGTAVVTQPQQPQPFTASTSPTVPGQVIDTSVWKLTLPIGSSERPTEIKWSQIQNYEHPSYFYNQQKAGEANPYVVFIAPAGGVTTSGSHYPRSELREMKPYSTTLASWSNTNTGIDTMTGTWAITSVPKNKPHVVAAQIHDSSDDVIEVRLEGRRLFLESDGTEKGTFDSNYVPSTTTPIWFNLTIRADATYGIRVTYSRLGTGAFTKTITYRRFGSGWYFKAGCYTQSNRNYDAASAYGAVRIRGLKVSH